VPAAPPAGVVTRTFDYGSGAEARFWEVSLCGRELRLRFGTPAAPASKTLPYPSPAAAAAAAEELIAAKLDDGFVERGKAAPRAAAPVPAPAAAAGKPGGVRHFEFVEGKSSKFWEVWVTGSRMTTRYGRIGSEGTMTVKDYPDEAQARRAADKLISEKLGKGYVEKGG
jgi:predicted DNA-binding WGR domain protein